MSKLIFRLHAIQRMSQRRVSRDDVIHVLADGETIENYPDTSPYPSRLILGWCGERPLHMVAAANAKDDEMIIVTVYEPDLSRWMNDFRRRRR